MLRLESGPCRAAPSAAKSPGVVLEVTDNKRLWKRTRKREYFDWARRVVDGLRGVHPGLEGAFDREFRRWPK